MSTLRTLRLWDRLIESAAAVFLIMSAAPGMCQTAFDRGAVLNVGDNSVSILRTVAPVQEMARIPLPPFQSPLNIAMSPDGQFGFVASTSGINGVYIHKIDLYQFAIVAQLQLNGIPGMLPSSHQVGDLEMSSDGSRLALSEMGLGGITYLVNPNGSMSQIGAVKLCDYLYQGSGIDCVANSALTTLYFRPDSSEVYAFRTVTNSFVAMDTTTGGVLRRFTLPFQSAALPRLEIQGLPSFPDLLYFSMSAAPSQSPIGGILNVQNGIYSPYQMGPGYTGHVGDIELKQYGPDIFGIIGTYGNYLSYITNQPTPSQVYVRHFNSGALYAFPAAESAQRVAFDPVHLKIFSVCPVTSLLDCSLTKINIFDLTTATSTNLLAANQNLYVAGLPGFSPDYSHYFYPVRGTNLVAAVNTATNALQHIALTPWPYTGGSTSYLGARMYRAQGDTSHAPFPD